MKTPQNPTSFSCIPYSNVSPLFFKGQTGKKQLSFILKRVCLPPRGRGTALAVEGAFRAPYCLYNAISLSHFCRQLPPRLSLFCHSEPCFLLLPAKNLFLFVTKKVVKNKICVKRLTNSLFGFIIYTKIKFSRKSADK